MGNNSNFLSNILNIAVITKILNILSISYGNSKVFFKKTFTALEIIFYIFVYYVKRFLKYLKDDLINDEILFLEL
jgi:hypothetical protein